MGSVFISESSNCLVLDQSCDGGTCKEGMGTNTRNSASPTYYFNSTAPANISAGGGNGLGNCHGAFRRESTRVASIAKTKHGRDISSPTFVDVYGVRR
mmetsp:Transcript_59464/g.89677  ORF Transcript_59464/g.89677 Transcript_59464/m.89677 type:complete len:98 (+) Transcript_59464:213-506(+)